MLSYDYDKIDRELLLNSDKKDEERISKVKNLKMESLYYNLFRSTLKKIINKYENEDLKEEIIFLLNRKIPLTEKRDEMLKIIKKILTGVVEFTVHDKDTIEEIYKMNNCMGKSKADCDAGICGYLNNSCKIIFPKNNLITDMNNSIIYYNKLADELVRNERIKKYILNKKTYLSLELVQYKLNNNEFLIYESDIDQDYLSELFKDQGNIKLKKNIHEMVSSDNKQNIHKTINYDEL